MIPPALPYRTCTLHCIKDTRHKRRAALFNCIAHSLHCTQNTKRAGASRTAAADSSPAFSQRENIFFERELFGLLHLMSDDLAEEGDTQPVSPTTSKLLDRAVAGARAEKTKLVTRAEKSRQSRERALSSSEPLNRALADENEGEGACGEEEEEYPVQVVSINDDGTKFELRDDKIAKVMAQIPSDMKVALVSIVGAFRTGKSFLLTLILRYLSNEKAKGGLIDYNEWIGEDSLEGNTNEGQKGDKAEKSFAWRGGRERNTTGIWMWSRAFIRKCPKTGDDMAILLLDTQGMFDSNTAQMLTASIFGLSTLLSSYQIYNVKELIGEDNLQHLALFSEYGRMALAEEQKTGEGGARQKRPFQRLDFLVRDYQNFNDDEDPEECEKESKVYLEEVFAARKQEDLSNTREQITSCFETIGNYVLPHPGLKIAHPKYDGNVKTIRNEFCVLLNRYLHRIFNEEVEPKMIHNNQVTAAQLLEFVKAYVELFRDCTIFPEAKSLLDATAEANNRNAKAAAVKTYKESMDKIAAPKCKYVADDELASHNKACVQAASKAFHDIANMGLQKEIDKYEQELLAEVDNEWENYRVNNGNKDPYKNLEFYILPIAIAFMSYFATYIVDACAAAGTSISPYCRHASDLFNNIFWCVMTFFLVMIASTGQGAVTRAKGEHHCLCFPPTFASLSIFALLSIIIAHTVIHSDVRDGPGFVRCIRPWHRGAVRAAGVRAGSALGGSGCTSAASVPCRRRAGFCQRASLQKKRKKGGGGIA
jgi:atlastin